MKPMEDEVKWKKTESASRSLRTIHIKNSSSLLSVIAAFLSPDLSKHLIQQGISVIQP